MFCKEKSKLYIEKSDYKFQIPLHKVGEDIKVPEGQLE